jgi:hypothetical protein
LIFDGGGERPDRRVVVVNGYGCNINSPLRPYLDRVGRFVLNNDVHTIIYCGSATQQMSFPGMTEARVMSEYVLSNLPKNYRLVVYHEEDSYTTCDNALGAVPIIRHLQQQLWGGKPPRPGELTVFCEAQRLFKVMLCYWLLMPDYRPKNTDTDPGLRIRFETDSWERANPLWEIPKLFNELFMLWIPPWRRYLRNKRIAASELR